MLIALNPYVIPTKMTNPRLQIRKLRPRKCNNFLNVPPGKPQREDSTDFPRHVLHRCLKRSPLASIRTGITEAPAHPFQASGVSGQQELCLMAPLWSVVPGPAPHTPSEDGRLGKNLQVPGPSMLRLCHIHSCVSNSPP